MCFHRILKKKKKVYFLHGGCDQVISPQGKTQLVGGLMGHCQAVGKFSNLSCFLSGLLEKQKKKSQVKASCGVPPPWHTAALGHLCFCHITREMSATGRTAAHLTPEIRPAWCPRQQGFIHAARLICRLGLNTRPFAGVAKSPLQ